LVDSLEKEKKVKGGGKKGGLGFSCLNHKAKKYEGKGESFRRKPTQPMDSPGGGGGGGL